MYFIRFTHSPTCPSLKSKYGLFTSFRATHVFAYWRTPSTCSTRTSIWVRMLYKKVLSVHVSLFLPPATRHLALARLLVRRLPPFRASLWAFPYCCARLQADGRKITSIQITSIHNQLRASVASIGAIHRGVGVCPLKRSSRIGAAAVV